jgi:cation diffusion facilitator family transporter
MTSNFKSQQHLDPLDSQHRREKKVRLVAILTAVMMLVEITVGYATGSMALLADGWHMATHVGALGLASVAYSFSRRYADHRSFVFGAGKINALSGFASAVALVIVALFMIAESLARVFRPEAIDFARSLPVAVVGLVVNGASVLLLHVDDSCDHDPHHDHVHDHNHRAAFMHVVADTLTSLLAIVALLAGKLWGLNWLDPVSAIVGGSVILKWGHDLSRHAGSELLDISPSPVLEAAVRQALETAAETRVVDLRIWSNGGHARSCVVTVACNCPQTSDFYRAKLAGFRFNHATIEVRPESKEAARLQDTARNHPHPQAHA